MKLLSRFAFHPYLLAVYPVLVVFAVNTEKLTPIAMTRPACVLLAAICSLHLLLRAIIRDGRKSGIVCSAALAFFFGCGAFVDVLRTLSGRHWFSLAATWPLLIALLIVFCAFVVYLRKTSRTFETLTRFLNITSMAAVLIATGTALRHISAQRTEGARVTPAFTHAAPLAPQDRSPDIFYFILDAYARQDTLQNLYGYDNGDFLDFLRQRGFYVADRSNTNYTATIFSLCASLNMNYLDGLFPQSAAPDTESVGDTRENESSRRFMAQALAHLKENEVMRVFKGLGYTTVVFSNEFAFNEGFKADRHEAPQFHLTEFEDALIKQTLLRAIPSRWGGAWQYKLHRDLLEFEWKRASELHGEKKPLFVFAHILAPHPPFVFDANGGVRTHSGPLAVEDGDEFFREGGTREGYRQGYIEQLQYLNKRMEQVIDRIIANSPDAVIVVQGDHGSRMEVNQQDPSKSNFHEAAGILNAYRLPAAGADKALYDAISPVNTFRVIFNAYFGADYAMLRDETYYVWLNHFDQLRRITDLVAVPSPKVPEGETVNR